MSRWIESNMNIMREMDRFVHLASVSDLHFVKVINYDNSIRMNYVVKDRDLKNTYVFELENLLIADKNWIHLQMPRLKLVSPIITPNADIHLLLGGAICYTFPGDIRFDKGLTCGYAVEQSFKWVFGYEFYLGEHYWPFAEMPHGVYPNQWGFFRPAMVA